MFKIVTQNEFIFEILQKAFMRSHGNISGNSSDQLYCFITPNDSDEKLIKDLIQKNVKLIVFGKISGDLAKILGLNLIVDKVLENDNIVFDHSRSEDISNYKIIYDSTKPLAENNPLKERYFHRFDFTDEWNNLGYGKITTDDSIWGLSNIVENISTEVLSEVYYKKEKFSVFSSIKDFENSSVLYINREVGTIDGLDWNIVEGFLNSYRIETLPSLPLIADIPANYNAVVSARLDCDQSIINTKYLVELYKKYNIDLSLAVSTGIKIDQNDIDFLNDFFNNGGAVLSHTVNHLFDWGKNYEVVFNEAKSSKEWIENNINGLSELKYAVSPFHTNKPYSIQALNDVGYKGFISGIIHNDPEYMIATSGEVPFVKGDIVSHSQQCMLHGDCYHRIGNRLEIYKESFKNHFQSQKIFGYLDHPFGDYDYGWYSEEERLKVHEEFINYINGFEGIKWMTCNEILDFVNDKKSIDIKIDNDNLILKRKTFDSKEKVQVSYKNKVYTC